jgi:hypothetical protein
MLCDCELLAELPPLKDKIGELDKVGFDEGRGFTIT